MSDDAGEDAGLAQLRALSPTEREAALFSCCASNRWVSAVAKLLATCASMTDLLSLAEQAWWELAPDDWLEAMNAHPKIGERTAEGSQEGREQGSMEEAGPGLREAIASGNLAYERRFGMVYVVRAAGRTPAEMLQILRQRLDNTPDVELRVAAAEQADITRLRLVELLSRSAIA